MSRVPKELAKQFAEIQERNYACQAKWFLNGFWEEVKGEAEKLWSQVELFSRLDEGKHADGCDLDEFASHRFLESLGETMTIIKLRETLRTIDLDNNKRMSLIEYLIYRYKKTCEQICKAPQGENKEAIEKARAMVEVAQNAMNDVMIKFEQAKKSEAESIRAEEESKARAREADIAKKEQQAALEVLNKEEKLFNDKIAELTQKSQQGSVVQKNKAANELAQLKAEDPLPLRKAKITQTAAVKKAEKASQLAAEAAKKAEERRVEAQQAASALAKAVEEAERRLNEANDFLEAEKRKGGTAQGDIWWMQRELEEKKKYMSQAKAAKLGL